MFGKLTGLLSNVQSSRGSSHFLDREGDEGRSLPLNILGWGIPTVRIGNGVTCDS